MSTKSALAILDPAVISAPAEELRERFDQYGYVRFPGLLTGSGLPTVRAELERLEGVARRRDFAMECTGGSSRHMTAAGGRLIEARSEFIPRLYADDRIAELLRRASGLDVTRVPDPVERHVANYLHERGDTHGAHFDDYPFALVIFAEAPRSARDGGLLEYAPHARGLDDLGTARALRAHHRPGDAYLLRSDTTAHRVTPLRRAGLRRVVLNFAYTAPGIRTATTPSAELLYGE
ncbi:HalD/BesD family halogenase [Streptomyces sp. H27-D2]|uniref:HalD/BesD family halogenase n=1 Tax=Streptomyces sp. H27-D2 TaxID=3046304 RepID=UPI002DBD9936|nr:hypothetical protein [Streptomyces sp. H27-D2]MEC4019225.1 hypothetical protein [Streptomyces sp. H27-D2]